MTKQELRSAIRARKRLLSPQEIACRSQVLTHRFLALEEYQRAKTVYGYLPFNQEVRTLPILEQALLDGKQVALPKIIDGEMVFLLTTDLSQVQKSPIGAPEPIAHGPVARDPDALVLMPGLAFDRQGSRLGYGGGYYDRFLSREPEHPTVALCFDFQLVSQLPADPHDIPVHTVLWA